MITKKSIKTIELGRKMKLKKRILDKWCIDIKACKGRIVNLDVCTTIGSINAKNWRKTYWIDYCFNGQN